MRLLPLALLGCLLSFPTTAEEYEYRLNIGLFTDHYINDSDEYNEDNQLLQLSAVKGGRILTAATFVNSHYVRSYLVGAGMEWEYDEHLRYGGYLALIKGYEGHIKTHYEGLMVAPIGFINYRGITINVIPAAYSIGFEFDF